MVLELACVASRTLVLKGGSTPHALASVSPSSWCVCQFRHFRT